MKKKNSSYKLFKVILGMTVLGGLVFVGFQTISDKPLHKSSESRLMNKARELLHSESKSVTKTIRQKFEYKLDGQAEIVQSAYQKALQEYDILEKEYSEANRRYAQLLENFVDEPHNPDLLEAFRDSDEILQKLLIKNGEISEIYGELVNHYSEALAKK